MYDVICETPAAYRIRARLDAFDEAQSWADTYVKQFGKDPGCRISIWDRKADRTIVVHEADPS